jgi:iron complex outermembrane receptor protein
MLDTVVVVASRADTRARSSRSVAVITRADIAASPARTIPELLASSLGVDVYSRSAAQADVSIRGSTADQVLMLVDGVRVSDVQSSHYVSDLTVPLDAIERIEVLRGVASAVYGPGAVGGVINIVTRRGARAANAAVRGGSFGSVGGDVGGSFGDALNLAANYDKSDGHRDGTDFRIGQGRVSYAAPLVSGTLSANAGLAVRDFGAADFYAPYNSIERTVSTTADARWNRAAGAWTIDAVGSTRRHQDHYVLVRGNPALYENRHESWQTTGSLDVRRSFGDVTAVVGTELEHDQLSSLRLGGRREWREGTFGEVAGTNAALAWNAGARADHASAYGDFVSPSASAALDLTTNLRLHASGGAGFRAPTWTERYYIDPSNVGEADLRVERFTTADAGVRWTTSQMSADVTTFQRDARDLIDWVRPIGATSPWHARNVGSATFHGIEATVHGPEVGGVRVEVFGSGIEMSAAERDTVVGKYALRPVTRQMGARLMSDPARAMSARLEIISGRRAAELGYTTANIRISWKASSYRLTLDALNLANAVWLDASGRPAPARSVFFGAALPGRL